MRLRVSLALVLTALGFMIVTSANTTGHVRRNDAARRSQLILLIDQRRNDVTALTTQSLQLRQQLATLHRPFIGDTNGADAADQAGQAAGLVAMRGQGLRLVVTGAKSSPGADFGERVDVEATRIHDSDLRLIVNALWTANAEAVSVNGQRIVATTPIRGAGETITVNFHPLAPPYEINAIGADEKTFKASRIAKDFRRWNEAFGVKLTISERDDLRVPAFAGRVRISLARVVGP